jgi:hypothetical protein
MVAIFVVPVFVGLNAMAKTYEGVLEEENKGQSSNGNGFLVRQPERVEIDQLNLEAQKLVDGEEK